MNPSPRLWTTLALLLALAALSLLAAGLASVKPAEESNAMRPPAGPSALPGLTALLPPDDAPGGLSNTAFGWVQILFILAFGATTIYYARRNPRRFILLLLVLLAVNTYLYNRRAGDLPVAMDEGAPNSGLASDPIAPTGQALPGLDPYSPVLAQIISLAVGGLLILGGALLYRRLHRRPTPFALTELALGADQAAAEIEAGGDLSNIVLRCYAEMTATLAKKRGLNRPGGMTPREFAQALREAGLPARSVERLTRLFENVRYGAMTPGKRDELEAVSCLREISEAVSRQPAVAG